MRFGGTAHPTDRRLLALTEGQAATGLGVAIYEGNGSTLLPLFTPSASKTPDSNAIDFTFVAKYMATAATVGAGTANAVTNFTISYN